tara:strand:- start:1364 stop:1645 length:282 start_codon:yes stop_codon:yes gene_type:complete
MKNLTEELINELECDIISARQAKRTLEKLKNKITDSQYKETVSLISEYLYDEMNDTEPEIHELILEEPKEAHYNWDEEKEMSDAWTQNYLLEE